MAGAVTSINGSCFVLAPAIGIGLYQFGPTLPYSLGAAALVALFIYWGWDSLVCVNEETEDSETVPGKAAVMSEIAPSRARQRPSSTVQVVSMARALHAVKKAYNF